MPNSQGKLSTAHIDTFCRDRLPPAERWPEMRWYGIPDPCYPAQLNAACELLDKCVAEGDGERIVFRTPSEAWTYRQLLETTNRIARVLCDDYGFVPGNRVLLRGPNTPMLAACWLAVLRAGGVAVCTMSLLRQRELLALINKAEVDLCLTDARVAAECEHAMRASNRPRGRIARFLENGGQSLDALLRGKPDDFEPCPTAADDTAIIAFTSGTTGQGKGTVHFHRDLMAVCDTFSRHVLQPQPEDIFCGTPPLAFTYALGGLLLFPMRARACAVLLEQNSPLHLLEAIRNFRPTICFTAPTGYRTMLPRLVEFDISSLRKCVSAGEGLPLATFEAWREATGLAIIDGIGSTEMLHIFISAAGDDIRAGSIGRAVPGYQAAILDNDGAEVPPGGTGRLAVRGPTGCRYLADLEQQRTYVEKGWNITGDTFRYDADGYFCYEARTDDMIISAGYNIAGPEIENVLLEHPKVAECAVIGVPDPARGMIPKAFVVVHSGVHADEALVRELQDFVKRQIAPYKYPRSVKFLEALPRTLTGKLQRYRLREEGQ